jgi:hypothetical protein
MTTTRELIRRLIDAMESTESHGPSADQMAAVDEARAYLSQPEPAGATDEELLSMADDSYLDRFFFRRKRDDGTAVDVNAWEASDDQLLAFARAVLKRWGR